MVLSQKASALIKAKVNEVSLKGLLARNKNQTRLAQERAIKIKKDSQKDIKKVSKKELLILGACLYWAEGYKRPIIKNGKTRSYHPVSLSNSDPQLVAVFMKFLREICQVEENRIFAGLRIYQHHNSDQLLQFWSKLTKIPTERFHKFYYGVSKSSLGKRPFNILPYGTIQIRVNSTSLYHKIMGWIEALSKIN